MMSLLFWSHERFDASSSSLLWCGMFSMDILGIWIIFGNYFTIKSNFECTLYMTRQPHILLHAYLANLANPTTHWSICFPIRFAFFFLCRLPLAYFIYVYHLFHCLCWACTSSLLWWPLWTRVTHKCVFFIIPLYQSWFLHMCWHQWKNLWYLSLLVCPPISLQEIYAKNLPILTNDLLW